MSDLMLNNLGVASLEHGFFIRFVMVNGNGWLLYLYILIVTIVFHGLLKEKIRKTVWLEARH